MTPARGGRDMKVAKKKKWTMPKWMELYRNCIVNTGGNAIEDMVNGDANPQVNLPLSTLQACVKSQVALLALLHVRECLNNGPARR